MENYRPNVSPELEKLSRTMTPGALRSKWSSIREEQEVCAFYGQRSGAYGCFSNFHRSKNAYSFVIPACCDTTSLQKSGRSASVVVSFGEKAIMLCKASIMHDYDAFDTIKRSEDPRECKRLGRRVNPWDQEEWDRNVCAIALEVVMQKVANDNTVRTALMSTKNSIIAEMTDRDKNWGSGVRIGSMDQNKPWKWTGSNILGWALMEARESAKASGSQQS